METQYTNPTNISANPSAVSPVLQTPAAKDYIAGIQSQLADKQAQMSALKSNNFTDTNQLQQNSQGQYVPSNYEAAKADYTKAYQDYIQTLNPSTDVTNAQNTYNNYIANQSKGIAALAGKDAAVPVSLVRGQQARLLSQTQPEATRLQNQIGIAQNNQTARSNAGLANVSLQEKLLGMQQTPAQQAQAILDAQKEQVGINNTQVQTQNIADKFAEDKRQFGLDYALKQQQLALDQFKAGYGSPSGVATYVPGANPLVDSWVTNINNKTAKFSDIKDPNLKNLVAQGLSQTGTSVSDILTTTKQSLDELNAMVNNESPVPFLPIPGLGSGFRGAVGAKGISSLFGLKSTPIAGTAAADFDAKLNQVKNDVLLPNLDLLKGLGRVTDREFRSLQSAVTSLSPSLSESEFKKELKDVTDRINAKISESQSTSPQTYTEGQTASDGQGNKIIFKGGAWVPVQ